MMIRVRKTRFRTTAVLIRVKWSVADQRSRQQVISSFPAHLDHLPTDLADPGSPLTQAEKTQVAEWIAGQVAERRRARLPGLGGEVLAAAAELAAALEDPGLAPLAMTGIDRMALRAVLDRLLTTLGPRCGRGATEARPARPRPSP